MRLTDVFTPDRIQFTDKALQWRDAIRLAMRPLIDDGSITPAYIDAVIGKVEKAGPYIDLGSGVALPHARPEDGVNAMGMTFLRTSTPVNLLDNPDHAITVFISLAATDNNSHLEALAAVAQTLGDPEKLERLKTASSGDEVRGILAE